MVEWQEHPNEAVGIQHGAFRPSSGAASTLSSSPFTPPTISLPKGGGALRGIGEKFSANPATGTGSFSLPVSVSPGRSGFGPELALTYDSGAGNGIFGLGWNIGLPAIARKTDKGLPKYDDASESDVFILSGAEDLVPAFRLTDTGDVVWDGHNRPVPDAEDRGGYHIVRYRPRTEGLFARIERWTKDDDRTEVFWRAITRDNVTSFYGLDRSSRIFDPDDEAHIFSWLICESCDDKGNGIQYEYKEEDGKGVDVALPYEQHHRATACATQRYIKSIRYGNVVSRLHPEPPADWHQDWLFEAVFDYGEGHYADLPLDQGTPADEQHRFSQASRSSQGEWPVRPDPFSTYRAGFETRTYRRCHRVLMFHSIPELGAEPYLVRGLELGYADFDYTDESTTEEELQHAGSTRFASFLMSATQHGYEQTGPQVTAGAHQERYLRYLRQSMPAVTFRYSKPMIDAEIRTLDTASAANLPVGLGEEYHWVDLDAEGIAGVLTDQGGAWWYKRNKGGGRLEGVELVARRPATGLRGGRQLLDLAGDGALDLVELSGGAPGFYERTEDGDWAPHRSFSSLPNLRWDDPNLRFIDLDGDGHADVLITEQDAFTWHPSLAEEGFGPARRAVQPFEEEYGPRLVFADGTDSVFLADMSGSGLADLVRIANGEVCYWPNLGYGRFGERVLMDNAPLFDHDDQFGQQRVRLADIDGSGVTDIVYLGRDGTYVYFNQSGNRWTDALPVTHFPLGNNTSSVSTADLLGNGTSCLVWSSPLPGDAQTPLKYIDLMAGEKPHLLVEVQNNLGAETTVHYASSTHFYLADHEKGTPRITRLPFPVHVVERVETIDRVSRNRFASRYEYHHGYFDGVEREFRGFGRVDQYDTEAYELLEQGTGASAARNHEASAHVPPVLTRTWFHTGVRPDRGRISQLYAAEYYREPALTDDEAAARLLEDTQLPPQLTPDEERQACRALRGSMLRQEVYALDGSEEQGYPFGHPYMVIEENLSIRLVQPQEAHRHAVFLTHPAEAISYHYERNPADPRVMHTLTMEVNNFGQVTRSASIGYARRTLDPDLGPELPVEQRQLLATCTETMYTNALTVALTTPDGHRTPAPFQVRTYHLTGLTLPEKQVRLTLAQVKDAVADADGLDYEEPPTDGRLEKRLIEQERMRYRKDNLGGPCGWGSFNSGRCPLKLTGSLSRRDCWVGSTSAEWTGRSRTCCPNPQPCCRSMRMLQETLQQGGEGMWTWTGTAPGGSPPAGCSTARVPRPLPGRNSTMRFATSSCLTAIATPFTRPERRPKRPWHTTLTTSRQ
ncbi:FG-GAP-like repeat-containing protein [Arthrobacter sp. FX8]|uniref:SpvB/TcaC N-terminal domain-containing protein n=1 Tax=Arthrobacter sp. FX8 TaxID=2997335 RepID=UPI00227AD3A8|nr:SpvB/TcaC N-terminal domain-containing protein [Arthrobacter sp. FX8]WAJ34387.1 FG-GAP-like repeat-containing protein [Arthrobacter sp. FX8]